MPKLLFFLAMLLTANASYANCQRYCAFEYDRCMRYTGGNHPQCSYVYQNCMRNCR